MAMADLAQGTPEKWYRRAARLLEEDNTSCAYSVLLLGLAKWPQSDILWRLMASILIESGHINHAAAALQEALMSGSARHNLDRVNMSVIRLMQGDLIRGWRDYASRWNNPAWPMKAKHHSCALWDGITRPGTRILLWSDGCYADTLQSARYLPQLVAAGVDLQVEIPPPLHGLLQSNFPGISFVPEGQARGRFHSHYPLYDLPAVRPELLQNLASHGSRYIDLQLENKPATRRSILRIGLAWEGKRNCFAPALRDIRKQEIDILLDVQGVEWVCLQRNAEDDHRFADTRIHEVRDFQETATIIKDLDLVISVDTAVAHLAAASGKPVWLLLPIVPDWRWMLEREDSPWYPTMKLFRQTSHGNWSNVLSSIEYQLGCLISGDRSVLQARPWSGPAAHTIRACVSPPEGLRGALNMAKISRQCTAQQGAGATKSTLALPSATRALNDLLVMRSSA